MYICEMCVCVCVCCVCAFSCSQEAKGAQHPAGWLPRPPAAGGAATGERGGGGGIVSERYAARGGPASGEAREKEKEGEWERWRAAR